MAYGQKNSRNDLSEVKQLCKKFIYAVKKYKPQLLNRPKFHILLHLSQSMEDYGRTSSFNSERY